MRRESPNNSHSSERYPGPMAVVGFGAEASFFFHLFVVNGLHLAFAKVHTSFKARRKGIHC